MAGSGHLQTFRLLRFLRSRGSMDGHVNYGIQMAVSSYFYFGHLIMKLGCFCIRFFNSSDE